MEVKKSPKADLERKRLFFLEIGFILALAATFFAFEWPSTEEETSESFIINDPIEEIDMIPITHSEKIVTPPPPPAAITDIIEIIDNEAELPEELDISSTEIFEDDAIPLIYDDPEEINEPNIFVVVEHMPEFPGGMKELTKYLSNSIKYPVLSLQNGIQGKVYLKFVINEQGKPEQITVMRGVDKNIDAEAIRVVKAMPQWTPGKQRNKAVKVWYTLPINFAIR